MSDLGFTNSPNLYIYKHIHGRQYTLVHSGDENEVATVVGNDRFFYIYSTLFCAHCRFSSSLKFHNRNFFSPSHTRIHTHTRVHIVLGELNFREFRINAYKKKSPLLFRRSLDGALCAVRC